MATAHLPNNCGIEDLAVALGEAGVLEQEWDALVVQVGGFMDVGAMAFLCAWAAGMKAAGRRIHLRGDERTRGYLARMDLHEHVGLDYDPGKRQDETGRFLPLKQIATDEDVFQTVNAICDLVLHQFENAGDFIPAMEWAVNETIDNIVIHSETPVPGAVCAQYFPKKHRLDIGICDLGRGIKSSLGTTRKLRSHGDAITTALQRGVTRDKSVGQGNGLAGSLDIAKANEAGFQLWTGDVVYRLRRGAERGFAKIPALPGTGLMFSLDTRKPVDLSSTWIAGGDWSFINAEAERIEEAGGINVGEVCIHQGNRRPATRLRRKLSALLPEMDEPLVLDFSDVTSASSSFLDELLGRLADELGRDVFEHQIHIAGMSQTIRSMANVVIAQRLQGLEPEVMDDVTDVEEE